MKAKSISSKSISHSLITAATTACVVMLAGALATSSAFAADELAEKTQASKAEFIQKDESLKPLLEKAAGYVIFPKVAKGGLGVGAARGTGQLFEKGKAKPHGEAVLTQVSVGFQAGGQVYAELVLFEDQASLDGFRKGNFEFSAQVSAVAVTAGVGKNAKYEKGVMVLTLAEGGLMYEASVGGQKFKYKAY